MHVHVVAEDVAFYGLKEHGSAAFQALEKAGAAETHEAFAGAGEIVDVFVFLLRTLVLVCRNDVISKPVAWEVEFVDDLNHVIAVEAAVLIVLVILADAEL